MTNRYNIELTETQLRLIWRALESFERVRMGQFNGLANDLAFANWTYEKSNPNNSQEFDERIIRRNESEDAFDKAFRIARPKSERKTEDMLIAEDMWMQIRSEIDITEWRKPLWNGSEPPMKISEV